MFSFLTVSSKVLCALPPFLEVVLKNKTTRNGLGEKDNVVTQRQIEPSERPHSKFN